MPSSPKLQILGTAAAEGWPAPWCLCDGCKKARQLRGRNIRLRSGALIDDDLKIDFGPDTVVQMQQLDRDLSAVRTILFTHEHGDHLCASELEWAVRPYTLTPPSSPIDVYGNEPVRSEIRRMFPEPASINLSLHPLVAFKPIVTATGDAVLPLPAQHAAEALLLRITRRGKTLFYGHDSGLYPTETLDALCDGVTIDVALFDCTYGPLQLGNRGHMGIDGVLQMAAELRRRGALAADARCIATHFSHGGQMLHDELIAAFKPHNIDVAFDGMMVQM